MSFSVVANDALRTALQDDTIDREKTTPGVIIQEALLETLKDDAVRREVYEELRYDAQDLSVADVHIIMDALLKVLGEQDG